MKKAMTVGELFARLQFVSKDAPIFFGASVADLDEFNSELNEERIEVGMKDGQEVVIIIPDD
jgi:hypothetical protein